MDFLSSALTPTFWALVVAGGLVAAFHAINPKPAPIGKARLWLNRGAVVGVVLLSIFGVVLVTS